MKKLYILIFALFFGVSAQSQVNDSIAMNASYANDVYYSLKNGEVLSTPRATWDIGFSTVAFSASIIANIGAGVDVYIHPSTDTTQWASLDTTGIASWTKIYNADTTWEEGAFNQQAAGHPDYGWCIYNSLNHNLYGYRMFILKAHDGSYKKLWIKMKYSFDVEYVFVFANLDNTNEQNILLDASQYPDKNFIYYDLVGASVVDHEPVAADWDLVFTRYFDMDIPYMVVGVLQNYDVTVAQVDGVDNTFSDTTGLMYSDHIKTIGSDWKAFSMTTMSWTIADTTVYFVKTAIGEIYKLYFTGFGGSSTGKAFFTVEAIHTLSSPVIEEETAGISIYPNPSNGLITLADQGQLNGKSWSFILSNLMGQEVYRQDMPAGSGNTIQLPASLSKGLYIVRVTDSMTSWGMKLMLK
jgi:hypothetical protein